MAGERRAAAQTDPGPGGAGSRTDQPLRWHRAGPDGEPTKPGRRVPRPDWGKPVTTTTARGGPSTATLGLQRGLLEIKAFSREREAVVFTFALPVVLLLLLGSV